jgi:hypothetical protein
MSVFGRITYERAHYAGCQCGKGCAPMDDQYGLEPGAVTAGLAVSPGATPTAMATLTCSWESARRPGHSTVGCIPTRTAALPGLPPVLVWCFRLARERARIVREEHALQNADDTPKELDRHEETNSEQKPPT